MKKLVVFVAAVGVAMLLGRGIVIAGDGHDHGAAASKAPADAANTACPVTGEAVDPKGPTYTYKGKVYHFCCASCIADFKKDPEKYIKKMKEAEKAKGHDHHE